MPITIALDLDDTLYLERDYLRSGLAVVSAHLERTRGVKGFASTAEELWDEGTHIRLFDAALAALWIEPDPDLIAELVALYRGHEPNIRLAPDAEAFLGDPHGCDLALITDGRLGAQRRKIAALALDRFAIDPVVCTDEWGQDFWKPHLRAFEFVRSVKHAQPADLIYVADNPAKDFLTPRALGWRTVQIDRPGAVHARAAPSAAHRADIHIASFDELTREAIDRLLALAPPAAG